MKRTSVIIVACLGLGAVLNVAVAWACCCWSPDGASEQAPRAWPVPLAEGWPTQPAECSARRGFGYRAVGCTAKLEGDTEEVYVAAATAGWPAGAVSASTIRQTAVPAARNDGSADGLAAELLALKQEVQRVRMQRQLFDVSQWDGVLPIPAFLSPRGGRGLPIRPMWTGLVINTVLYAALLWLLIAGPGLARRAARRTRGCCPACGYPTGASPVCTECGATLPRVLRAAAR